MFVPRPTTASAQAAALLARPWSCRSRCAGSEGSAVVFRGPACRAVLSHIRFSGCSVVVTGGAEVACTAVSSEGCAPAFLASGNGSKLTLSGVKVQGGTVAVCSVDAARTGLDGGSCLGCSSAALVATGGGVLDASNLTVRDCGRGALLQLPLQPVSGVSATVLHLGACRLCAKSLPARCQAPVSDARAHVPSYNAVLAETASLAW
jgi:hypothetical protein